MIFEEQLLARHRGKSILLDSNLLLVLLAGKLDTRLFGSFKRISAYSLDDFGLLIRLLSVFQSLLTTPHILTEVNNLANSLPEWIKPDWQQNFAALITSRQKMPSLRERWTPAAELAKMPEFAAFGITDAALTDLSTEALIVTDDYRLSGALRSQCVSVLNFSDLRNLQQLL